MVGYGCKLMQMAGYCFEWLYFALQGLTVFVKFLEIAETGWNWLEMSINGWKWLEMAGNDWRCQWK